MKKIIFLIGLSLILTGCTGLFKNGANQPVQNNEPIVGNDRDEHGCIGSAGYSWCEAKGKCLRPWEENCAATSMEPDNNTGAMACTQEAKRCPDGTFVARTGPNCEFALCPGEKNACTCPVGYYLEATSCNPDCYKSTPKCLLASIPCTPLKDTEVRDTGGTSGGNQGIANPASVYCTEQGGESVIVTNPDGSQGGNCVLPDGKTCDEWEYYRGTCK